jgi:membrane-associated phospholipid phosphatase
LRKNIGTHYLLLLLCLAISQNSSAQSAGLRLLQSINGHETPFKNNLFAATSTSVYVIAAGVPIGMVVTGLAKKDKNLQKQAIWLAGGYLVAAGTTQALKTVVKRQRPFVTHPQIVLRNDDGKGYAMPSNHSSGAFYMATALSLQCPKWYIVAPAYTWAATVGYGRMYQGVHYPGDVLVGAVIGAGTAWLSHHLQKKINQRKK